MDVHQDVRKETDDVTRSPKKVVRTIKKRSTTKRRIEGKNIRLIDENWGKQVKLVMQG